MVTDFMGKLPNGTVVTDITVYAKGWKSLGERLEAAYPVKVVAYDPDFVVVPKDTSKGSRQAHLPVWLVTNMVEKNK